MSIRETSLEEKSLILKTETTSSWWSTAARVGGTLFGAGATATAAVAKYLWIPPSNGLYSTLSTLGIGAAAQTTLEFLLPTRVAYLFRQFQMRNFLSEFFVLTACLCLCPYPGSPRAFCLWRGWPASQGACR